MAKNLAGSIDKEKIKPYLPFIIAIVLIILFLYFIFLPQNKKMQNLSSKVTNKKQLFFQAERAAQDINTLNNNIVSLEKEIAQLEEKLPEQIEASLLIDTLKDITQESKIQFVSIEPKNTKKYEQPDQKQVYLELPITVRLKCGFNELIGFVKKIESSKRLMKISDLKIRGNPQDMWGHDVEVTISTFSALKE
ncbi:MAG: type 4a pilus biogenesis protein PilO [Candidatus Omnitrophica bacterium]|nr:type 4a pilus biogenesis protein PilO [Candidatus Omnitrophota bacterium]HOX55040.1 type 4a pilus biogenesis protein PilO [Candidatus Omnitrophota bacterium]